MVETKVALKAATKAALMVDSMAGPMVDSKADQKVVEKVAKAANKDCGCAKRKAALNNPDLLINKILK